VKPLFIRSFHFNFRNFLNYFIGHFRVLASLTSNILIWGSIITDLFCISYFHVSKWRIHVFHPKILPNSGIHLFSIPSPAIEESHWKIFNLSAGMKEMLDISNARELNISPFK
jgi:hypothetical protein